MERSRLMIIFVGICCIVSMLGIGCEGDSDDTADSEDTTSTDDTSSVEAVAVDEIPLTDIVWLHTDVSEWDITSELKVSLSGSLIVYDQDGTSKWPATYVNGGDVSGNSWVFIYQDGVWYGATHEWMTPGQTHKEKSSVDGAHMKKFDYFASSWTPTPGVEYGFMVSGLCRSADRNVEERTQIVLMTWE